jgi:hypothetical protein
MMDSSSCCQEATGLFPLTTILRNSHEERLIGRGHARAPQEKACNGHICRNAGIFIYCPYGPFLSIGEIIIHVK